jgi:hypothetical protein
MKALIFFIVSLFIITNFFSQKYTIDVSRVNMHTKNNNINYEDVVTFPDKIIDEVITRTTHVLNISDSTCSFYYYGIYVNTIQIVSFKNLGDVLYFTMADYDINGLPVYSNFVIDTNNNKIFYHWFNEIENVTKVEIKIDFTISVN